MPQVFSIGWLYLLLIVLIISIVRIWLKIRTIQRGATPGGPVIRVAAVSGSAGEPVEKAGDRSILAGPDDLVRKGELSEALKQLDRALEDLSPTEDRETRGKVLLRIGACHGHLAGRGERFQHLLRAGEALREAVRLFTPDRYRDLYMRALSELATVYGDLAQEGNSVENLMQAARTLETAALSASLEGLIESEATFLARSGDTYRKLSSIREPGINLRKAVSAYEKAGTALERCSGESRTSGKISVLKLRGDTLESLAEYYQRVDSLAKALNAYQEALGIMDKALHSREQMILLTDMGRILLKLYDEEGNPVHLRQALRYGRDALEGAKKGENQVLRGMAMAVLADALTRYADFRDRRENLSRAVKLYEAALGILKDGIEPGERDRVKQRLAETVGKLNADSE